MTAALEAFFRSLQGRTSSVELGRGELITTPWDFRDGEPVSIYVYQEASGLTVVTDRGQAADSLAVADVNLEQKTVRASWQAIRGTIGLDVPSERVTSDWELAAAVSADDVGEAIRRVAEAALRTDGLKAFAGNSRTASSVKDRLVNAALQRHLEVIPSAPIPNKYGARRSVTASIRSHGRTAFVQAVSKQAEPWNAADKARSLFMDSEVLERDRFTLVEDGAKLRGEHLRSILQHSQVVTEQEVPGLLRDLAA